jgi:hypothetical protein
LATKNNDKASIKVLLLLLSLTASLQEIAISSGWGDDSPLKLAAATEGMGTFTTNRRYYSKR